jgi:hypothetical protein
MNHFHKLRVTKSVEPLQNIYQMKMAELRGSRSYGSVLDPKERGAHPRLVL